MSLGMGFLAFLHDGEKTADLDLNDGGVWVTNQADLAAGHLNYPSRTIDAVTKVVTPSFDVSQEGNRVLVHDLRAQGVQPVETATWMLGQQAQLPKGAMAVQGEEVLAVGDPASGKLWILPVVEAGGFTPDLEPVAKNLDGLSVTVGKDDLVHVLTPDSTVTTWSPTSDSWKPESAGEVGTINSGDDVELTAVGRVPVVLDRTQGWVGTPGHEPVDLDSSATVQLQQPGPASDVVALATDQQLLEVPVEGGTTAVVDAGATGNAARPVQLGGCIYAVWSGSGVYRRDCDDDDDDVAQAYDTLEKATELVFRTSRDVVVLDDTANGDVYLVNEQMELVQDWKSALSLIDPQEDENSQEKNEDSEFHRTKQNHPPRAADHSFGVRAGTTTTLPVLANDTDPDGDLLLADADDESPIGALAQVRAGRALGIDVPDDASGSTTIRYTAEDGRGGSAAGLFEFESCAARPRTAHPDSCLVEPANSKGNRAARLR
ncbi:MAG: Ig-like domain-containing protein [Nocardioides sp.]